MPLDSIGGDGVRCPTRRYKKSTFSQPTKVKMDHWISLSQFFFRGSLSLKKSPMKTLYTKKFLGG